MIDSNLFPDLGFATVAEENRQPITEQMRQIAKRVVRARQEKVVSQRDLAERLAISQPMMSHYERGERRIPSDLLADIVAILGVSADTLLGTEKASKSSPEMTDDMKKLWKKFQQVLKLPEDDQRAVIRLINSVAKAKPTRSKV
ncbi:MAG: helix-turn-helix domain-containing protein [Pirellula sp.]